MVAIYTHEDLEGAAAEPLPVLIPHPALHAPRTGYALAKDVVHHVGEPIAMVVAENRYLAEDAAARIDVEYEPAAGRGGHPGRPGGRRTPCTRTSRTTSRRTWCSRSATSTPAMAAAPHRLEFDLTIERSCSMPLEGKAVHARWDPDDRSLRVYSSTQAATSVRAAIAAKLGLPLPKVEVIAPGRRRRLRGEDHAPVAGGDPGADGGDAARPAR